MGTVIAIGVLVLLFAVFPFIGRERGPRQCGGAGCWKKKIGFGCGSCPVDNQGTDPSARKAG